MSNVQTVRGPIDSTQLGRTYMHEHIFVMTPDVQQNYPDDWGDEDQRLADAVGKLHELANQGIRTIVDPTVVGLGRYIPRIQRVAEAVPELHIVVATGMYTYDEVPNFFRVRGPGVSPDLPEPLVELFVRDIEEGIAGTGVRAGMLKCAIDEPGMRPGVERIMRAVGAAHLRTGVPITVHTHPSSRTGLEVKRLLCDELGVAPSSIVLGHSGDSTDCDHLSELAEEGFVLGLDRFGLNYELTFEQRCDVLVELCKRGFADRIVLAHDNSCYIDWMDEFTRTFLPQWHYLHIGDDVLPYAREHGVTEEQIHTMLVEVPRRVLEGISPPA